MDNYQLISNLEIQIFKYKVFKREALLVGSILTFIVCYFFYLNEWQNKFIFMSLIISCVILFFSFYRVYANRHDEKSKLIKEVKKHFEVDLKSNQEKNEIGLLSKKLDEMMKEAKIDGELMASLGDSIKNFEGVAKDISPSVDSINTTKKYGEEMSLAATEMESLNELYKVQLESTNRQEEINYEPEENLAKLKEQMQSLASDLSSLNDVYRGDSSIKSFLDFVKSESHGDELELFGYNRLMLLFKAFEKEKLTK